MGRTSAATSGGRQLAEELNARLGVLIKQAEQALIAEKSKVLRPHDLTVPQYAALLALHYLPGQSAAQLARTAMVTPQTMATILGNLESKGLIERIHSPLHTKVLVTTLTAEGESLVVRADVEARAIEKRLAAEFSADEREVFRGLLERSVAVLRRGNTGSEQ